MDRWRRQQREDAAPPPAPPPPAAPPKPAGGAPWPHANDAGWWDGPKRFKQINRGEVAIVQNEIALTMLGALTVGKKIDMGGPSSAEVHGWDACNILPGPRVTYVADACASGIPTRSYGAVATFHSIEHMHDPIAFLRECDRILQLGGYLYIVCPDKTHHRHDMSDMAKGSRCYNEWNPSELLDLFGETLVDYHVLTWNTRQNNFDFEILARKTTL